MNTPTAAIPVTISDADTPAGSLTLSGNSSNPTLVPTNNLVFGGNGANRTVTVSPAADQTGSATITVSVSDGTNSASDTFVLTVSLPFAGTQSFTNVAAITIPNSGTGPGASSPYPSVINVSNMAGTISSVMMTLKNLSHTWTRDIDILLVGPTGQTLIVMSDAGGDNGSAGSAGANNVTLTFSDAAATVLPDTTLVAGTYRPTNYVDASIGGDNFPSPAPLGPWGTNFSVFQGLGANGAWSLYVFDDGPGDKGSVAGGWSLSITTVPGSEAGPTISDILDQTTLANTPTAALPFTVADAPTGAVAEVDALAGNLTLSGNSSNLALVPTNNIVFGGGGTNLTVTVSPAADQSGSATITVTVSDGQLSTNTSFVLTVIAVNTPPMLAAVSNCVLNAGQIFSLTNSANDTDAPPQVLTFSLLNCPTGATLNATSGVFTWRPTVAQGGSTNLIEFMVADNGVPVMSATQSFMVTVNTLASPSVTPLELTDNQFTFLVTGDVGPDYTVQGSSDLALWTNLFTTNSPAMPFAWTFTNTADFSQQFFRILLGP